MERNKEWKGKLCALFVAILAAASTATAFPPENGDTTHVDDPWLTPEYYFGVLVGEESYGWYREKQPDGSYGPLQMLDSVTNPTQLAALQEQFDRGDIILENHSGIGLMGPAPLELNPIRYQMNAGYTLRFLNGTLTVDTQLGLNYDPGISAIEKQEFQNRLETTIENWVNEQFRVRHTDIDGTITRWDLAFDITFDGYPDGTGGTWYDQYVDVDPGNDRSDAGQLYLEDSNQCLVHESLHWLGAYDEYWGGALDARGSAGVDDDNIMGAPAEPGSLNSGEGLKEDYFWHVLWKISEMGDDPFHGDLSLETIPEPTSLAILAAVALPMAMRKRRTA